MTYEFIISVPGQPVVRPWQRAIVLVAAMTIAAFVVSIVYPETGIERVQWPDYVVGALADGILGLASGLGSLWRLAIGLFVVSPIDRLNEIVIGRPDAFNVEQIGKAAIQNTVLTWLLPYLDPPGVILRWVYRRASKTAGRFREAALYVGYGLWLILVVFVLVAVSAFAVVFFKILTGYPDKAGQAYDLEERLGAGVALAIAAAVVIATWLGIWFWRRRKTRSETRAARRETTPIPAEVADAVRDSADPQR